MNRRDVALALMAGSVFLIALSVSLPDGAPGSSRSIATGISVGLNAAATVLFAGGTRAAPPKD